MLSWLYKNRGLPGMPKPTAAETAAAKRSAELKVQRQVEQQAKEQAAAQAAQRAAEKAELKAKEAAEARAAWQPRLLAAMGEDTALLGVAQATPVLEIKLAAIEALLSEDALKQAERLFRSHDRRVHRVAKQRFETAVATRESRARALTLIAAADALTQAPLLAANQLVALDRDWQALNAELLEPVQRSDFDLLRERLNTLMRDRGDQEQQWQRWKVGATRALADLRSGCVLASRSAAADPADIDALTEPRLRLTPLTAAARALREQRPDTPASAALDAALAAALDNATGVEMRLAWLDVLQPEASPAPAGAAVASEAPAVEEQPTAATPTAGEATPAQRWLALPPLADEELTRMLNERFDAWQLAHQPARPAPAVQAPDRPANRVAAKRLGPEQRQQLETQLQQAEAALAEGQLSELQRHLQAFDATLGALRGVPVSDVLRARQQTLHAEHARLKGWQQWGGGRARDDLVAEAEQLAQLTLAAAPAMPAELASPAEPANEPQSANASDASRPAGEGLATDQIEAGDASEAGEASEAPKQTAEAEAASTAIEASPESSAAATLQEPPPRRRPSPSQTPQPRHPPKLRLKEHGEAIQAMRKRWKELDRLGAAASQALWQRFDAALTIAYEPIAAQQAALKAARQENLAAREALLGGLEAVPLDPPASNAEQTAARWKEPLQALDHFQRAWRQLGPLEHTVPNSARAALLERLRSSVARIETPLHEARSAAEAGREKLIARAQAIAQELGAQPQLRDATARVRELQAEWQQQARTVLLMRGAENALWARFKAATDAVFAQRDAAFSARDAELAANLAAREALLARLTALRSDTPTAEIQRTLTEVDRAWRQPVDLPRGAANALDARLQEAHVAALKAFAVSGQGHWQALCDTLAAKLALCEERESASASQDEMNVRWATLTALPTAWERALAQRWAAPTAPGPLSEVAVNDLLLQLETALDMPATLERLAARRDLKLRAMKDALEGRGAPNLDPARRAEWLAAVLRQSGLQAVQRERLAELVATLRLSTPGTLVPASTRS